jgi:hypothetical protein
MQSSSTAAAHSWGDKWFCQVLMRHERKGEDQKKLEAVENAKSKQETRAPNPLLVSGVPACHSHAHPLPRRLTERTFASLSSSSEKRRGKGQKKKKTRSSPKGKPASVRNLEPAEADKGRGGQRRERERGRGGDRGQAWEGPRRPASESRDPQSGSLDSPIRARPGRE